MPRRTAGCGSPRTTNGRRQSVVGECGSCCAVRQACPCDRLRDGHGEREQPGPGGLLLEVRASHRGRGIGSELVRFVLEHFEDAYMIDAVCDPEVAPFYERLGMIRLAGMAYRNRQSLILDTGR